LPPSRSSLGRWPAEKRRPYTPFGDRRRHSQGVVRLHESG